ncbi:MAG: hypothetical protein P8Y34_07380 [Anaerolineales bacterium]
MYLLGIDIGSTVIKAAIFDLEGNELGVYGQLAENHTGHGIGVHLLAAD